MGVHEGQRFVRTNVVRKHFDVCEESLRTWADNGLIDYVKTPGGQRLYDIASFRGPTVAQPRKRLCYCRVSSAQQKDDLQRQVEFMRQQFPDHDIVTDIASGINFKRQGLQAVLESAFAGTLEEVVVAYRDRLTRFAFELVKWILEHHGVKLVVLHKDLQSPEQELTDDLLSIIHVFSCRANGRRKYKRKLGEGAGDHGEPQDAVIS